MTEPRFFATPAEFRAWFAAHHAAERELIVGFYKRQTGRPSITWPESVDEALCFGWIDGVRRSIDGDAYTIRFTPRRPESNWSKVNIARVAALEAEGRMTEAGRAAYARRRIDQTRTASYEQETPAVLTPEEEALLRADVAAARDFDARPPWYRRTVVHWIVSARRLETRARRLQQLIAACAAGQPIGPLDRARPPGGAATAR